MAGTRWCVWLVAIALVTAGCSLTHRYQLSGFDASSVNVPGLRGKRVAVVFVEPGMRREYVSKADGHTFIFQDTQKYYTEGLRNMFGGQLAALDFYDAPTQNPYDLYLFPSLQLDVSSSFITKTCSAKYTVLAFDPQGHQVFTKTAEAKYDFAVISAADSACKVAILNSFGEPTGGAMDALIAMGSTAPPPAQPSAPPSAPAPTAAPPPAPAPVAATPPAAPPPANGQACLPACRSGYVCYAGKCISACNPPCPAGQRCTSQGECVQ